METKICKQCGRRLGVEAFRQYPPRGRGVRETKQGRHTLCMDCESLEYLIGRLKSTGDPDKRLPKIKEHYTQLAHAGRPPVTKHARELMGLSVDKPKTDEKFDTFLDSFKQVSNTLMRELEGLLSISLDGLTPDEYTEIINPIVDKARGADMKPLQQYVTIVDEIRKREADHEDNYVWEDGE